MTTRQIVGLGVGVFLLLLLAVSAGSLFENIDADEIMVVQSPVSGELTWHLTPGLKWQGFGKVTVYKKRAQYWFSNQNNQGQDDDLAKDRSQRIQFNDGGHANLSGGISWELPLDETSLNLINSKYGSPEAVEQQLVRPVIEKSIYMSGPLMSSTESYAERKSELIHLIEDQIQNGVYLTKTIREKQVDPITKVEKTVSFVQLIDDSKGGFKRAEESPLSEFNLKVFNLTIDNVRYDAQVETQIQEQQKSIMQVQIAMIQAKEAQQREVTVEAEGRAVAEKAKWEQKAIAAKAEAEAEQKKNVAVTEANQKLEVAKLETEAAEQKKLADIALGEGESQRRKLVMEADGALEKKLEAYVAVNSLYAKAIGEHNGNWVPQVVMGASGDKNSNGATDLISLLLAKTAKDLSLDLNPDLKK
jgi:regulator of protease activity HflC (stomatin/prohibitin superfamily)